MPYQLTMRAPDLLWVVIHGRFERTTAEKYYHDAWGMLNDCPRPTDLLLDGRGISGMMDHGARHWTDRVAHHPHLGHIAFVVPQQHLLIFAPFVKLVSGIGMFGSDHEALAFLHQNRGKSPGVSWSESDVPPLPDPNAVTAPAADAPLAARMLNGFGEALHEAGRNLDAVINAFDRSRRK